MLGKARSTALTSDFSAKIRLPAETPLAMPAPFGRYELQKLLAVGGMAEVFLARSRSGGMEKRCVIKRVLPRYSTNRQFVSMFIDEARITIGLDHANIVRLFDFGQVDSAYYMALEYVEGCDLVDVLRGQKAKGEAIPPLLAAHVARCVLRGLHHAHMLKDHRGHPMGIVHRDVSPQNVFLRWNGDVKIGDFGIADARNKLTRTLHGTVKGKFSYMSPEQATGGMLDGRSDVFAVGVLLWEALVGGRLFAADNPVQTMNRVLEAPVTAPSEMRADVPEALDRIVLGALKRPLAERTASAALMADQLDEVLQGHATVTDQWTSFLHALHVERDDSARQRGTPRTVPQDSATVSLPADVFLRALHLQLRKEKNLWTLVDIAERHAELGDAGEALAAARVAACVFAHRGLLIPAICALHSMRTLMTEAAFVDELRLLGELRRHHRPSLQAAIKRVDDCGFFAHLQDADPEGLGREDTDVTRLLAPSPLFAGLSPSDFARLAAAAEVEERPAEALLVEEGERGDCLYAIGRGRVVVFTRPDKDAQRARTDRVYVAALSEGDFFGEFSLLTRSPRSATVEAATDVVLLRIDRSMLEAIAGGEARVRGPLVEFYKDRVAELLLARNAVLGALTPEARRALLSTSQVARYKDMGQIVQEGEAGGSAFLVITGEVEVYHIEDGFPVFIDKLRDGQMFGEMAAVAGQNRSASVRAIGEVELLVLDGATLADAVARSPETQLLLAQSIEARMQEAHARIAETIRIFQGV